MVLRALKVSVGPFFVSFWLGRLLVFPIRLLRCITAGLTWRHIGRMPLWHHGVIRRSWQHWIDILNCERGSAGNSARPCKYLASKVDKYLKWAYMPLNLQKERTANISASGSRRSFLSSVPVSTQMVSYDNVVVLCEYKCAARALHI